MSSEKQTQPDLLQRLPVALPLVRGAADIARVLGLPSERAAFHLLSSGKIPGSLRVGNRWYLDVDAFREAFRKQPER